MTQRFCGWMRVPVAGLAVVAETFSGRLFAIATWHSSPQWESHPVLVIHGTEDERILINYVRQRTGILSQGGTHTRLEEIPGEDHFLFLSSWGTVSAILSSWMNL